MLEDFMKGPRIGDPVNEDVFVNVCLHGLLKEYHSLLENLSFPSFSSLMEVPRNINKSMAQTSKPSFASHLNLIIRTPRKRPIVIAFEKDQGTSSLSSKGLSYKHERKTFPVLPRCPFVMKKATTLLEQWVKDSVVILSYVDHLSDQAYQRNAKCCPFHHQKGHSSSSL